MAPHLSPLERRMVLGLCPGGSRIVSAAYFRHHAYPCPIRVVVRLPSGSRHPFVVRVVRSRRGSLRREAALYPLLAELGLPVPLVLAGPEPDPRDPSRRERVVLSLAPGVNLQRLAERGGRSLSLARALTVDAVSRLHALTAELAASRARSLVPSGTLRDHLRLILRKRGPWQRDGTFLEAAGRLAPVLDRIETPLVFSNGDYQPANFLAEGGELSGFVDFEFAWFEDPLYGFAKYPIYDLRPLRRAGVVEAFLWRNGFTRADFLPRLALGCLATLSREMPVRGGDRRYREHVLSLLGDSLRGLGT